MSLESTLYKATSICLWHHPVLHNELCACIVRLFGGFFLTWQEVVRGYIVAWESPLESVMVVTRALANISCRLL